MAREKEKARRAWRAFDTQNISSIADSFVAICMTYNLPKALDEQIVKLIHRLYKFGGLRKGYH